MRDPYSVLGVRRNAGSDEIKAAWRTVAKSVHPDQNRDDPQATARFAEAGRAYEVLKDPKLRNRYDHARREADLRRMEEMARKARPEEEPEKTVDPETAEEMISRIFSAEGKVKPEPKSPPPKAEAKAEPKVEMKPEAEAKPEAPGDAAGEPKAAAVDRPSLFPGFPRAAAPAAELVSAIVRRIRGGAAKPLDKVPDIFCEITVTIEDIFRRERPVATLPDGQTLKVTLPPGTTDGSIIRLKEQGYRLNGLLRGDLVVNVHVLQDGAFRTDGMNLRTTLPIGLQDAVLGCETMVATLTGPLPLTVPAWSGSETVFTLAGHGLPGETGTRGDLLVELRLMLRDKPDEKLIDLMLARRNGLFL